MQACATCKVLRLRATAATRYDIGGQPVSLAEMTQYLRSHPGREPGGHAAQGHNSNCRDSWSTFSRPRSRPRSSLRKKIMKSSFTRFLCTLAGLVAVLGAPRAGRRRRLRGLHELGVHHRQRRAAQRAVHHGHLRQYGQPRSRSTTRPRPTTARARGYVYWGNWNVAAPTTFRRTAPRPRASSPCPTIAAASLPGFCGRWLVERHARSNSATLPARAGRTSPKTPIARSSAARRQR